MDLPSSYDLQSLGASLAVVIVVVIFLKFIQTQNVRQDERDKEMTKSIGRLTKATEKNTKATIAADEYLRQRNGRDIDFHKEVVANLKEIPDQIKQTAEATAKQLRDFNTQKVKEQKVGHQTIIHQDT